MCLCLSLVSVKHLCLSGDDNKILVVFVYHVAHIVDSDLSTRLIVTFAHITPIVLPMSTKIQLCVQTT